MNGVTDPTPIGRVPAAVAGTVSAGVALGVGELVSAMSGGGASLVSAVGTEFIDRFAASLKDVAVALFGTNDKTALVVGIVVTSLLLGAAIGVLASRRFWFGAVGFAAFGALGCWAYWRDPFGSTGWGLLSALSAAMAGLGALALLLRVLAPARRTGSDVADGVASGSDVVAAPRARQDPRHTPRRTFLISTAMLSAGAVSSAVLGRRLRSDGAAESARRRITIARPSSSRPVPADSFDVSGLTPYVTPNRAFYRIDTALTIPQIDPAGWQLDISGLVDRPYSLSYDDLLALDAVAEPVTLQCVSNEVGGNLVGNAVWQGVPLAELLARAQPHTDATQIVGRSIDRFTAGFPGELANDGRVALVAYAMNGEPLPVRHGFPARLIVAGLYGYVSATKWLQEIELTTWDSFDGYWISRGWSKEGPIKTASRIDVPAGDGAITAGPTPIAGVAWAPTRGISAVELRIDESGWQPCELGEVASENTWVQWRHHWDAPPGDHVISVRAIDSHGNIQTGEVASPAPDGATGWHSRRVRVVTRT